MPDKSSFFGKEYTEYWRQRAGNASDGTRVADAETAYAVVQRLFYPGAIPEVSACLDVGCSTGRMIPMLGQISNAVYGLELDPHAASEARTAGYISVENGSALAMNYDSSFFDLVFCWAVLDAIPQQAALIEFSRVLKPGGYCIITGKNARYRTDDNLAIEAEIGAAKNGFINHFTNVRMMVPALSDLGFHLEECLCFESRGDFGELAISDAASALGDAPFYEYAMLLKRGTSPLVSAGQQVAPWDCSTSFHLQEPPNC